MPGTLRVIQLSGLLCAGLGGLGLVVTVAASFWAFVTPSSGIGVLEGVLFLVVGSAYWGLLFAAGSGLRAARERGRRLIVAFFLLQIAGHVVFCIGLLITVLQPPAMRLTLRDALGLALFNGALQLVLWSLYRFFASSRVRQAVRAA